MYCVKCGHHINDGSAYCANCGASVPRPAPAGDPQPQNTGSSVPPQPQPQPQQQQQPQQPQRPQPDNSQQNNSHKSSSKKPIIWICVGVVLCLYIIYSWIPRFTQSFNGANPSSIGAAAAYVQKIGYSPNTTTGPASLMALGYTGVGSNTWYGENPSQGVYDLEVVCNGTGYRLRYTSSGDGKGWTVNQLGVSVDNKLYQELPACKA